MRHAMARHGRPVSPARILGLLEFAQEKKLHRAVIGPMLLALARNRGRVLSREQLLENVWGYDYYGEDRVVDVHIGHIRQKLGGDRFIVTVRGVGYVLKVA